MRRACEQERREATSRLQHGSVGGSCHGPSRIATATDEVVGNFSAGFDVIGTGGASFRIYYDGRFGDLIEEHAGGIKGTLPF